MTTSSYPDTRLLIANEWQDAAGGKTIPVVNPATGQAIGTVAHAGIADLDRALAAAQKGFETWRAVPAYERAATMRRAASLLRERAADIARLLTQEQGKPLAEAKMEAIAGAEIIDWFAAEGMRVYGRIVPARSPLSRRGTSRSTRSCASWPPRWPPAAPSCARRRKKPRHRRPRCSSASSMPACRPAWSDWYSATRPRSRAT
jgi:hypothetical protein